MYNNHNTMAHALTDLPAEIIATIVSDMSPTTTFALKYTNKQMHTFIQLQRDDATAYTLIFAAATDGDLQVVEWLHSMGCTAENILRSVRCQEYVYKICDTAARNGHLPVLKWLNEHHFAVRSDIVLAAAFSGSIEIFVWLTSIGRTGDHRSLEIAAALGHRSLLEWFYTHHTTLIQLYSLLGIAAAAGQISTLDLLIGWVDVTPIPNIEMIAAFNGHLSAVEWILSRGCYSARYAKACALSGGHHHIVEWIDTTYGPQHIDAYPVHDNIRPCYDAKSPQFVLNQYCSCA